MLTSSGYGAISPLGPSKVYRASAGRETKTQSTASRSSFDSLMLSSVPMEESRSHMELVGRLSQEVRTATTTGDIATLRQQVSSGEYQPDPAAIAARILFLVEG